MKILKKNTKLIVGIIIGAIIATGITTYAAYNYYASQVSYTKKDGTEVSVEKALNELYASKKTATASGSSNNYSTEEQVVGTWIDGKPLYRKLVTYTYTATGNSEFSFNHNISDVDFICVDSSISYLLVSSHNYSLFQSVNSRSYNTDVDSTKVLGYEEFGDGTRTFKMYIFLQYTKTTD